MMVRGCCKTIKKKRKIQRGGIFQLIPFFQMLKQAGGGRVMKRSGKKHVKRKKNQSGGRCWRNIK